ncbi:MAG: chemotaxis protein CheW [Pseudomonadales bacterium]|nr:chemotaxis protein CheW [Pseudomonadales bacterium]
MQTFVLPSEALSDECLFDTFDEYLGENEDDTLARFHGIELNDFHILIEEQLKCEIIELQGLCAIPFTPSWFVGVINVRGSSVPIIELEDYLGYKRKTTASKYTIVINNGLESCGILLNTLPRAIAFEKHQAITGHFNIAPALEKHLLKIYEAAGLWLYIDMLALFTEAFSQFK